MAHILIPLPSHDFDPSESAVPWRILKRHGHTVSFATPDGQPGQADPRMLSGEGLGPWSGLLRANADARAAYGEMAADPAFAQPMRHDAMRADAIDALLLPGGHAQGMKPYLESPEVQALIAAMFALDKPVAAVCHGVLAVARARGGDGRSVLHGRKTTALPRQMEMSAWLLTCLWLGDYYRTYPISVQEEVTECLARPEDYIVGPQSLRRDRPDRLDLGFVVRDGNYLSARWPGDVHRLGEELAKMLAG